MYLNIKGNPGNHNRFEENRIDHVETLCPNATNVTVDRSVTVQISFSLNINLNGERVVSLLKTLRRKFHLIFKKLRPSHVNGSGKMGTTVYIFCSYSHNRF